MASGTYRETLDISDSEEELFAGFTMEEIIQIDEEHQRQRNNRTLVVLTRTSLHPEDDDEKSTKNHKIWFAGHPHLKKLLRKIFHFPLVQPETLEIMLRQRITFNNSSMTITLPKLLATL